ncbi:MAG: ABC transporter ATP-binding protein, partial [Mariprofundaceae bacterium]
MSSDLAIHVNGLSKSYRIYDRPHDRLKQTIWRGKKQFFHEFSALQNVSFDVKKGETLGIIGRNGSGKSTLLQMICGTLSPSAGDVEIHGRVSALLELGAGFNPEFTGRENIYMNASILGLTKDEVDSKYAEIIDFADIGQFVDQPVKTYSSGMYVRLAFAVAVSVEPDILIVDEALSVGDEAFQRKCFSRIQSIQENG